MGKNVNRKLDANIQAKFIDAMFFCNKAVAAIKYIEIRLL